MYLLYSLLSSLVFLALLPWFAIEALRTRKYITGLSQRLGRLPSLGRDDRPLIWLHCVSVGETAAARPLVRALFERFPSYRLVISTTTVTGQQIAREAFGHEAAAVFYFPIDWAWTMRRVLRALRPAAILIMETELWPHLLRESQRRAIPVALINGRISIKSFGRYRRVRPFMRRVLSSLSIALMQSEEDAARIRELGIPDQQVLVAGNLKFDSAETAVDTKTTIDLGRRFGFDRRRLLIVAASTHAPEERVVIEAFKQLRSFQTDYQTRLLIAPRHPARFTEVASLLQSSGLTWSRRSLAPQAEDQKADVVLLDSVGELGAMFPLADVAFVGGSIAARGGHNVLEPGALGVCIVTGAHTDNFAAVTQAMLDERAMVQLPDVSMSDAPAELARALHALLSDESLRRDFGHRALIVCERNRGATERTLRMIAGLLESSKTAGESVPFPAVSVTVAK